VFNSLPASNFAEFFDLFFLFYALGFFLYASYALGLHPFILLMNLNYLQEKNQKIYIYGKYFFFIKVELLKVINADMSGVFFCISSVY
jgi:hypothetical protein